MYILDTWYRTLDIWHRYLICYYLTLDTWHLISAGTWHVITWHLIPDTWCLTPVLDMLSLDTWHMLSLVLTHLTWYCDTWLDTITPDICVTLHIHDYHFYGDLDMIIILLPDIWYSWTFVSPVLMSPALLLLLIAQTYRRPAEHAWCYDDEDVSHDRASVRRILNGTKCHTEQSATPHTCWGHLLNLWGPPLESIPTHNKVPHGAKCHTTHVVGATSWICGATSRIHSPHRIKCHMEQSVTPHTWWGHLLNLWEPLFDFVGLPPESTSSLLPAPPGVSVISILSTY